jgi:ethanolamine transporter
VNANQVILSVMSVFFALGCVDRILGNRFGLGGELERGFSFMGSIALSIVGLTCIAPVVSRLLEPVVVPVYHFLGADAAMFSGSFLAPDSGGYAIAVELASDPRLALFSGLVVAAVMGTVISFTIPVACGLIDEADTKYLAIGILSAFIVDPVGCLLGGLLAGLSFLTVLRNLVPVFLVAVLIAAGLYLFPRIIMKAFYVFSRCLMAVITVGLACAAVEKLTGFVILPGMNPITAGFQTVGSVVLILAGSMPLIFILTRLLRRPLDRIGRLVGVNEPAMLAFLISLATIIPTFTAFRDMNPRGKVVVAAFTASTANLLGAHLGFVSATDPTMIAPMMVAKISAGALALPLSVLFAGRLFPETKEKSGVTAVSAEQKS